MYTVHVHVYQNVWHNYSVQLLNRGHIWCFINFTGCHVHKVWNALTTCINIHVLIMIIIISDNEYITSGKDGLVLKDVAHDKTYILLDPQKKVSTRYYSLSHKTINSPENFWNVYCFTTNQMRDETAKDNRQTTAGISHDLIWNNKLGLSSTKNLQFSLWISLKKLFFLPQTNTSHLIPSVQKANYRTDLKVSAHCENLQWYRFTSWVKVSQLQKNTDRKPPITAN